MIKLPELKKLYVRVCLPGVNSIEYKTFGPFVEPHAVKIMKNYLSTGICSWVEKVE